MFGKTFKKTIALVVGFIILFGIIPINVFATQSRTGYFSKQYSLNGNAADNMLAIAQAQLGKTKSDLAYTEAWCANFVCDCAILASETSAIPQNGNVQTLYNKVLAVGGKIVTSRAKGDLIFYNCSACDTDGDGLALMHVGIVLDSTYSIEGNYNGKVSKVSSYTDEYGHKTSTGTIKRVYVRPAYKGITTHTVDSSYGTNFTAYPKAKITATDIFDAYHNQISSTAWIGTSDKCTIHEVYTDGCCRVSYPLDSGGTETVYSKISLFDISHTCNYSAFMWYEAAHPHYNCYKCSICGEVNRKNSETNQIKTCSSCWYAKFNVSASSISLKVGESKTISVTVDGCYPDTAKTYGRLLSGNGVVETQINNNQITFKALKSGTENYEISVYSDSSRSHLIDKKIIPITVSETTYTGRVSFDKSSISLVMPTNKTSTLTIKLTGTWPEGAGYTFDYNSNVVSMSQNGTVLTITAKNAGSTNFTINIVNKNNNNALITSAVCPITVKNETYTIKYDANGGTGAPASQIKTYGTPIRISGVVPEREGYVFLGWSTSPTATSATYAIGDFFENDEDTTLYAIWTPIKYSIRYIANGGVGSMLPSDHTFDVEKPLAKNSFVREGYVFLGWSKDKNATVASYKDGATVSNLSAVGDGLVNLYAVWKEGFYGDVNEDGAIDFDDILLLNKIRTDRVEGSKWQKIVADVDGNGEITIEDVEYINSLYNGNSDTFPVEEQEIILTVDALTFESQYYVGEKINSDRLSIWLYYTSTDFSYNVTEFCEVQIPDTSTIGQKELVVSLGGYTASYSINIVNEPTTEATTIPTITEESTAYTDASTQSGVVTDPTEIVSSVVDSDITDPTETFSNISTEFVTDPTESTVSNGQLATDPAESTSTTYVETTADNTIPSSYDEVTTAPTTTDTEALVVRYLLGDANSDNKVSIQDATAIQKFIAKIFDFDDKQILASDADQNGKVNIKDVTVIQRYLAGYDVESPVNTMIGLSSGDEEPTNPTDSDVISSGDEEATTPTDSSGESSGDETTIPGNLVEDAYSYSYSELQGDYEYYIPKININDSNIELINEEIWDWCYETALKEQIKALENSDPTDQYSSVYFLDMDYEWAVNGDILSLCINKLYNGGSRYYKIYNISLTTCEFVSEDALLQQAGYSREEYATRLKQVMASAYLEYNRVNETTDMDQYIAMSGEKIAETLSDDNLSLTRAFLNENGELCIVGIRVSSAGADHYAVKYNLDTYEVNQYYLDIVDKIISSLVLDGQYIMSVNRWGGATEYHIPKIMIDNPKIDAINKEIEDECMRWFKDDKSDGIEYEWGTNNNILSISMVFKNCMYQSGYGYYVYNISLDNYEYVGKEEVLIAAGVDEETYNQRQKEAMGSMIWDGMHIMIEDHISKGEYNAVAGYANALEETLAQKNLDASTPYFNKKGELCVMGKINNNVGSRWHTRFINITDYVLSPYYKEIIEIPQE